MKDEKVEVATPPIPPHHTFRPVCNGLVVRVVSQELSSRARLTKRTTHCRRQVASHTHPPKALATLRPNEEMSNSNEFDDDGAPEEVSFAHTASAETKRDAPTRAHSRKRARGTSGAHAPLKIAPLPADVLAALAAAAAPAIDPSSAPATASDDADYDSSERERRRRARAMSRARKHASDAAAKPPRKSALK